MKCIGARGFCEQCRIFANISMQIKKFVRYIDTLSLLAYSRLVCITQRLEYDVTYLVVSWELLGNALLSSLHG